MPYDLNFWPEPDWRREGTPGPMTWALLWMGLCLLAGAVMTAGVWNSLRQRQETLSALEQSEARNQAKIAELERLQQCSFFWDRVQDDLDGLASRRLAWAGQLAVIQRLIPETVVLRNLELQASHVKAASSSAPLQKGAAGSSARARALPNEFLTRYELRLRGVSMGEEAEGRITAFSRALPQHPVLSQRVEHVKLSSLGPDSAHRGPGVPDTEFVIVCEYIPFNWSQDHVEPPQR